MKKYNNFADISHNIQWWILIQNSSLPNFRPDNILQWMKEIQYFKFFGLQYDIYSQKEKHVASIVTQIHLVLAWRKAPWNGVQIQINWLWPFDTYIPMENEDLLNGLLIKEHIVIRGWEWNRHVVAFCLRNWSSKWKPWIVTMPTLPSLVKFMLW